MQTKSLLVAAGLAFATALAGCSTDGTGGSIPRIQPGANQTRLTVSPKR